MPSPRLMPRLPPILMALICASMLTGCAASTPTASARIDLPALPAALTRCDRPVLLPGSGGMSRADVERYWARDRAALVACGRAVDGLVAYFDRLARELAAGEGR